MLENQKDKETLNLKVGDQAVFLRNTSLTPEDRGKATFVSSDPSVATVNEKFHLQSGLIIARLGVPCRDYGVSVISVVLHGTQNQISSFAGDLGKVDGVKVKSIQVPVNK